MHKKKKTIFTIGHSTHSLEEFLALLKHYDISHLIDIRTVPRSRHNPQFNEHELAASLKKSHIKYTHLTALGGFRHAHKDSVNMAWHNPAFRGFADYMQTANFKKGIEELINYAQNDNVAVMCAEAVPWRCHRSLIADALIARNIAVEDIFSITSVKPHIVTPWARIEGTNVTYPALNDNTGDLSG